MKTNMLTLPLPTLKSEIILTIRDANTLEVKRVQKEENISTIRLTDHQIAGKSIKGSGVWGGSGADVELDAIYISERAVDEMYCMINFRSTTNVKRSEDRTGDGSGTYFPNADPPYVEFINRFQPPASVTRNIRTIFLGISDTTKDWCGTISSLGVVCTQTTTEILDITYRVQGIIQNVQGVGSPTNDNPDAHIHVDYPVHLLQNLLGDTRLAWPWSATRIWSSRIPDSSYRRFGPQEDVNLDDISINVSRRAGTFSFSQSVADNVGKIFGAILYQYNTGTDIWNTLGKYQPSIVTRAVPADFPNKPIQPIHNHNTSAVSPFLDVDFLASGVGFPTVNGDNWTNPDWPKFYRVEYVQTGDVGVSSYFFRRMETLGFGTNYLSRREYLSNRHVQSLNNALEATDSTIYNSHGLSLNGIDIETERRVEEYFGAKVISWDDTGITIQDLATNEYVSFDANTTPALNVSSVRQVAADDALNVWVADALGGLYKITDAFGTPTITKMTNATNGIPAGGDINCYAVTFGYNDAIIAIFNGGLSISEDYGTSWTNYDSSGSPVGFNWTGITDNNWANVVGVRADRENPDHRIGIVAIEGINHRIVWWDVVNDAQSGYVDAIVDFHVSNFKCSRYKSAWMVNAGLYGNSRTYRIVYGTASLANIGTGTWFGVGGNVSFFYDRYNTPYTPTPPPSTFGDKTEFTSCVNKMIDRFNGVWGYSGDGDRADAIWYNSERDPTSIFVVDHGNEDKNRLLAPQSVYPSTASAQDSLGFEHSGMSESIWKEYRWNSSGSPAVAAWELNYSTPAVDTGSGGNGYDGARHGFDIEDHNFTGRSMVDISSVFAGSEFGAITSATFAFYVTPETKDSATFNVPSRQEREQVIFEVNDADGNRLKLFWDDDGLGQMRLQDATTGTDVGTNPGVTGSSYRVVVTVDETTAKLYIDNVLKGSHTLASSLNFSNTGSPSKSIVAYVGARTHWTGYDPLVEYPWEFFRGDMTNVQIWNEAWNAADVATDNASPTGVISPVGSPTPNIVARYELTQSLVGLETKITHGSSESLEDGLTIFFSTGVGSPPPVGNDFVATDYHTFGVVDGILKDNAISWDRSDLIFLGPADTEFGEFLDELGNDTVPSTTPIITERMQFPADGRAGIQTIVGQAFASTDAITTGGTTGQHLPGNGYIEATVPSGDESSSHFGFVASPTSTVSTLSNFTHELQFNSDGTVDAVESGTAKSTDHPYSRSDKFRIVRTGTTITYQQDTGGGFATFYTSLVGSSGDIWGRVNIRTYGYAFYDMDIQYTRDAYIMDIGNSGTLTGKFATYFHHMETTDTDTMEININGTPADILVSNTRISNMTPPAAGQIAINGEMGILVFNSADVGKTITGNIVTLFDKF